MDESVLQQTIFKQTILKQTFSSYVHLLSKCTFNKSTFLENVSTF